MKNEMLEVRVDHTAMPDRSAMNLWKKDRKLNK